MAKLEGELFWFLKYFFSTASSTAPQVPLSKDAVIKPRTVATFALAAKLSTHTARSHPVVSGNPCLMIYSLRGEVSAPFYA